MTENEQKLFNLFNEYNYLQAEGDKTLYRPRSEKDWQGMSRPYRQYICSKHFEFVKWLCKNDKINLDKLKICDMFWDLTDWVDTECNILCHLAIQEDPIKFLATILR